MGRGGHHPTKDCHANHSRTRASVPCSPAHTFYFQIKTQKDSSQFGVGGWGAEATILLYAEATILLLWPYSTKKAYTKMA